MPDEIETRQLGTGHHSALKAFADAIREWAVPFLETWMQAADQPVPSQEEIRRIQEAVDRLQTETGSPPEGYEWLPDLLKRLSRAKRFNRRNFINVHPTPHVPSVLASTIVALQNPNNIVEDVSGPTWKLEELCIQWLAENLIGFDPTRAWGNVVSGGTVANMTALLVARDYCYRKLARPRPADVRTRGLYGLPAGVVLATAGSHYSVRKALWFLGMGDENVVSIPLAFDEKVRMTWERDATFIEGITDPVWREPLDKAIEGDRARGLTELEAFYSGKSQPFSLQPLDSEIYKALYSCFEYSTPLIAYVFTVGTIDTGTIEHPSSEALEKLISEDIFIHADAAAGGFTLSHPRIRDQVVGLDKVHSVTLDGHKFGHLAYPNGTVLFRDKGWMYEILHEAPYLQHLAPTLEGSRPGSHVAALWAVIQDLGETGRYERWLNRIFRFVDALVEAFEASSEFQILNHVDLTTIAVAPRARDPGDNRHRLNELVVKVHRQVAEDSSSKAFLVNMDRGLSGIRVRNDNTFRNEADQDREAANLADIYCIRIVATNPAVEPEDAEELVRYLERQLTRARNT